VKKTGHLVIAEISHLSFSLSSEIMARVTENCFKDLKSAPRRIGLPDYPEPTSFALTTHYYHSSEEIVRQVSQLLYNKNIKINTVSNGLHDVPGDWFKGPF